MRGTIDKYRLSSGETRWRVRWDLPAPEGERRQRAKRGFQRKADAEAFLAEVAHEQQNEGKVRVRQDVTVAEYARKWLDSRHDIRDTTRDNYRTGLLVHTAPRGIGAMRVQDVSPADLDRLYATLLREGKRAGPCRTAGVTCREHGCSPDEHDGLAVRSVQHVHTAIHAMMEDARRDELLHRNPAADAHRPKRDTSGGEADDSVTEDQIWADDERAAFLAGIAGDRMEPMWRLFLTTGLRRGEMVGLRWDDLDLPDDDRGTLRVRRSVTEVRGEEHETSGKSFDSRRSLTLGRDTVAALRAHRARQNEQRLAAGPAWTDSGRVFTRPDGRGLRPRWVTAEHRRWCRRLDLPEIGPHGLRHTHATYLLREGEPIQNVSARLGHADPSVTLRTYTHVMPDDDARTADRSDGILAV